MAGYQEALLQLFGEDPEAQQEMARIRALRGVGDVDAAKRLQRLGAASMLGTDQGLQNFGQSAYRTGVGQEQAYGSAMQEAYQGLKQSRARAAEQKQAQDRWEAEQKAAADRFRQQQSLAWAQEARQRERDAQEQWQVIADPVTGGFVKYNRRDGTVEPIAPGGAAPGAEAPAKREIYGFALPATGVPKMTEAEQKSMQFASRMAGAVPQLESIVIGEGYRPSAQDLSLLALAGKTPVMAAQVESRLSPEFRRYMDAAAPIVNAALRKESGAAITAEEWLRAFREWLPRPGEPDIVTASKMGKIRNEMDSLASMSGTASRYWQSPPAFEPQGAGLPGTQAGLPGLPQLPGGGNRAGDKYLQ
jgi:hypothetical protein